MGILYWWTTRYGTYVSSGALSSPVSHTRGKDSRQNSLEGGKGGWRLGAKCRARVGLTPNDVGFTEWASARLLSPGGRGTVVLFSFGPRYLLPGHTTLVLSRFSV